MLTRAAGTEVLETECQGFGWVTTGCLFPWGNIFGLSTLAFLECDYKGCRGIIEGVPLWCVYSAV